MKSFCDSCTDEVEVQGYEINGVDLFWCANCAEGAN